MITLIDQGFLSSVLSAHDGVKNDIRADQSEDDTSLFTPPDTRHPVRVS